MHRVGLGWVGIVPALTNWVKFTWVGMTALMVANKHITFLAIKMTWHGKIARISTVSCVFILQPSLFAGTALVTCRPLSQVSLYNVVSLYPTHFCPASEPLATAVDTEWQHFVWSLLILILLLLSVPPHDFCKSLRCGAYGVFCYGISRNVFITTII